jgi:hypothetical protein
VRHPAEKLAAASIELDEDSRRQLDVVAERSDASPGSDVGPRLAQVDLDRRTYGKSSRRMTWPSWLAISIAPSRPRR